MFRLLFLLSGVCSVFGGVEDDITSMRWRPQLDGRIVGGQETTIDRYPWQVSLQRLNSHFCGGSLYNENIVITAAHCVSNTNLARLQIRVGSSTYTEGGQLLNALAVKSHERYNPFTMLNDIALIRLATPVKLSRNVKPIKLATKAPSTGDKAVVTGWGIIRSGDVLLPDTLRSVVVKMVSNEDCGSTTYEYGEFIKPSMICAYAEGKDACQGDSGGPLVSDGRLVGVVSWGDGCAKPNNPGVYADVAHFHSWILNAAAKLSAL